MVLYNKTNRMKVYTLPHDEVCGGECLCTSGKHLQTALDAGTGEKGLREVTLLVPRSIHIPGKGCSENLPATVCKCVRVAADIDAGLLSVKD